MSRASLIALCKKDLLDIYNHAIDSVRPDRLILKSVQIQDNLLTVTDSSARQPGVNISLQGCRIHVIGGGKSVLGMARGLAQLVQRSQTNHLFSHGILSVPTGLESNLTTQVEDLLNSVGITCKFGSMNNLPDDESVSATNSILENVVRACNQDQTLGLRPLFIVLISGGCSACLTNPKYINLNEKLKLIRFLVQKGADIVELNKVRRFFSKVKAGQLASHILRSHPKAQVLSLIMSDVIGDPIDIIASGPTFLGNQSQPDEHKEMMLDVLRKYGYSGDLVNFANEVSVTSNEQFEGRIVINHIIGNNCIATDAAAKRAKQLGYVVRFMGNDLAGSTCNIATQISNSGEAAFETLRCKLIVIGAGEATVTKAEDERWGKGGRAQEMALDYIINQIRKYGGEKAPDKIDFFLAGGTDGQDGPTDVAACLASYCELVETNNVFSLDDALMAKQTHNSNSFWTERKADWLIKTGLTGTNVMDLYFYIISKS